MQERSNKDLAYAETTNEDDTGRLMGAGPPTIAGDQPSPFTVEAGGSDCTYFDQATSMQQSTGG